MQVHLGPAAGWNFAAGKVTIFGDGTAPLSYIDVSDVARFAVLALERPEFAQGEIVLGGPDAVSPRQALQIFEDVTGQLFEVRRVPTGVMRVMAAGLRLVNPTLSSLMTMACETALRGDRVDMKSLLERLPEPIRLRSVGDYAASTRRSPASV
jgi:nucleoside-diphosphate-sugar epimerase